MKAFPEDGINHMFLDKLTENDFYSSLESGIKKQSSFNENLHNTSKISAQEYLNKAAKALESAGLITEAKCITMMTKDLGDPSMADLTSDQMLKNLEEKGWVFNADDCSYCEGGEEPQLSQEELKKLRDMLK